MVIVSMIFTSVDEHFDTFCVIETTVMQWFTSPCFHGVNLLLGIRVKKIC